MKRKRHDKSWKQGDIIASMHNPDVKRLILEVRTTGYSWSYPDIETGERNYFMSENSNDPQLFHWIKAN